MPDLKKVDLFWNRNGGSLGSWREIVFALMNVPSRLDETTVDLILVQHAIRALEEGILNENALKLHRDD